LKKSTDNKSGHCFSCGVLFLAALLFAAVAHPASAQTARKNNPSTAQENPIHIKADRLVTDSQQNTAEFSGHVQAMQDDTVITSDKLTVHYRSQTQSDSSAGMDAITRIVAEGTVKIVFDEQVAYTQHADYIADKRIIVLTGPDSKIVSGKNTISGQKITLYRDDGRVQVEGSAEAPVEAFFYSNETSLAPPDRKDP
jgi:lipopolysaccharide export system protein LptA